MRLKQSFLLTFVLINFTIYTVRVINVNVRKTKEVNYDRFIIKKGQNIIWNDGL